MTRTRDVTKAIFPVAGLGTRFLPATVAFGLEREDLRDDLWTFLSDIDLMVQAAE